MKNRRVLFERPWLLTVVIGGMIGAAILINSFGRTSSNSLLCSLSGAYTRPDHSDDSVAQTQLIAILHYATSRVVPQQSLAEIRVSFDVLQSLAPCNFLVYGLGHDSVMWSSFNPKGTTIFLEEDPKWVQTVLKQAPNLLAHTVRYRTHLAEADQLLGSYKSEPACLPPDVRLRDNTACRLALTGLPEEVYDTEWDLIMIDAPRGYFPEAPGRMGAIFTAAVMARARKRQGVTHVFLHDVNRRIEKVYAEEFLCKKNLVKAEGRLWHFAIPSAANDTMTSAFC
ncbi:probable methyltransferase At1g27930 [Vitis riparia]|uniref:probable methyltransferase At1g27930 n=1 Tax=Vitis riparia TaxID=96939 RepID=UPI00155A3A5B|nr:probable methyltransferase At1g27930 [Vitis riparia]